MCDGCSLNYRVLSHAGPQQLELLTLQTEYKLNWTLERTMSTDGTINWLKSFINSDTSTHTHTHTVCRETPEHPAEAYC